MARFYNRASRAFLKLGHGRSESVIHRAVWCPGIDHRREAMHYVEDRVLETLGTGTYQVIVDLGCGVGGSLRYLMPKYNARYIGITISGVQAQQARRFLASSVADPEIVHANMLDVANFVTSSTTRSRPIPERKLFFAIESLIHFESPEAMLSILSGVCQKGDSLIIADDTLTRLPSRSESAVIKRFVVPHTNRCMIFGNGRSPRQW